MAGDYKQSVYMTDAVIEAATSLGVSPDTRVANAARSGQLGNGVKLTKLDGAAPAVFNPVVCIVLSVPSIFHRYPKFIEMLVSLIESHAKSISGIDISYTLETADVTIGHDGQTWKVPTRVTRSSVSPSFSFTELHGNLIWNLIRQWLFAIQHPDTNSSIMSAVVPSSSDMPEWLPSTYSMSMLCIQYDPTGLPDRIYDAYIIENMIPTETGEAGFERSIGTTKTMERSIPFTGYLQHNQNTRLLGIRTAKLLALHRINPDFALPGMAGSADPSVAIANNIQNAGGIKYETIGSDGSNGMAKKYTYMGDGGIGEFNDLYGNSEALQKTPPVEANPS